MNGDNRYLFICPFHNEEYPSFAVLDIKNHFKCFGCGIYGSSIRFIKEQENLNLKQAVDLLCQIYLFDIQEQTMDYSKLASKYQKAILSEDYKTLLEMGRERLIKRKEELMLDHAYHSFYEEIDIDTIYNERYRTIQRIECGEHIKPSKELKLK